MSYLGSRFLGPVISRFCGSGGKEVIEEGVETAARGIFNSVDDLPPVKPGFTRLYRGTGHPDIPQVSPSMRGVPSEQIPSGANNFLSPAEALRHAGSFHEDAVSASIRYGSASTYRNGGNVVVYDVPNSVFNRSSCQMLWK